MASSPDSATDRVLKARILAGLRGTAPAEDPVRTALGRLSGAAVEAFFPVAPVPAAVLVPLVDGAEGLAVLLTQRTDHLRDHPGQISFPGGRLEPGDTDPLATALRETAEEIGVAAGFVELAGYLPSHAVVTGFVVTPVVGFLRPGFELRPDPVEVADVFSVPLGFLLEPGALVTVPRVYGGVTVTSYAWQYGDRYIWGATAHMLKSLCDLIDENH